MSSAAGRELVVFHRYRIRSYAMARQKAFGIAVPRQQLRKGGVWWFEVQINIAHRDGDHRRVAKLRTQQVRARKALWRARARLA